MAEQNVPRRSIAVGVDASAEAEEALSWAAAEARRRNLPLTLVHGVGPSVTAWMEVGSPNLREVLDTSVVRVVGRYPSEPDRVLMSGWVLGAEKVAGKGALLEVRQGQGRVILFGFRPQYRGQTQATFPLLFNSLLQRFGESTGSRNRE